MLEYFGGIATWLSQGANCVLLKGSPDMTVSARCHVNQHLPGWGRARKIINRVFFWQADHCASSFASDVSYAHEVLDAAQLTKTPGVRAL